jgi:hypothetical protein
MPRQFKVASGAASVGTPQTSPEKYLSVFFAASATSQQAGKEALGRMYARKEDRDEATGCRFRR